MNATITLTVRAPKGDRMAQDAADAINRSLSGEGVSWLAGDENKAYAVRRSAEEEIAASAFADVLSIEETESEAEA